MTTTTQSSIAFLEPTIVFTPWRNPEQIRRLKEDLLQKQQQRRQQHQEAAARLLQPPSESQGFQYFYLPTKARVPVGQLRSYLLFTIQSLPAKKVPGVDHLCIEILKPIQHLLTPILLILFRMCWAWSYVPQPWRVAQIAPIYKKGYPSDPGNYCLISLISIFRKILEPCVQHKLKSEEPLLDIAQGGFRESRNALDQVLYLSEICHIFRSQYHITPVLTILDIKSACDAVDHSYVWEALSHCIPLPLLGLLRNLFDDVQIEVSLSYTTSHRFHPNTGVLQGSIPSPYL